MPGLRSFLAKLCRWMSLATQYSMEGGVQEHCRHQESDPVTTREALAIDNHLPPSDLMIEVSELQQLFHSLVELVPDLGVRRSHRLMIMQK